MKKENMKGDVGGRDKGVREGVGWVGVRESEDVLTSGGTIQTKHQKTHNCKTCLLCLLSVSFIIYIVLFLV